MVGEVEITAPPGANDDAQRVKTGATRHPWLRVLLLWVLPALALCAAYLSYTAHGRYVSTDNAYVRADKTEVAPEVSGNVLRLFVIENGPVAAGEPILEVDDVRLRFAAERAEARLAAARIAILALKASYREKQSELAVARANLTFAARELQRQRQLAEAKLIAASSLDDAEHAETVARGAVTVIERELEQIAARLGGDPVTPVDSQPDVLEALAALAQARLDLLRTSILAPTAGIVSHLPQVGDYLVVGRPAFAIVADEGVWIEANFKETDLEFVRSGMAVRIDVDTYPEHEWQGSVASIAQATSSEFAVLPAQNATGNWVKVVQRIAVRVAIDSGPDDPILRSGMSADVRIDTGRRSLLPGWLRALLH